jgi:hypothetical protein
MNQDTIAKERVFTLHFNLKNEIGNTEMKFDYTESEFLKISEQKEGQGTMLASQYAALCCADKLRNLVQEMTGKPTYIAEFSIYEEPQKQ